MSRRPVILAALLGGAVLLGACAKSDTTTQPSRTLPGDASTTTAAKAQQVCSPTTPVTPPEGKPTVTVPDGAAPTTLVVTDVKVGDGAEAKTGDKVSMQYVGVAKSNGKEFDSSWKRNEPFEFTLGEGNVIKGWDQGIVGMKVGGRRTLVIPADLGYGASPPPGGDIGANDTLVFTVDLQQVCSTPTTAGSTPGSTPGSIVDAGLGSSTTTAPASSTTAPASTTTAK